MQKMIYGLAIAAMAVGVSAFSFSQDSIEEFSQATFFYTLNQAGDLYTRVTGTPPPEDQCQEGPSESCIIGYESDQGPTLDPEDLPHQPDYSSTTEGYIPGQ